MIISFSKPVSFGLVLLLGQMFMIYNSASWFGEQFAEEYTSVMIGYLIFFLAFFASLLKHPLMKISFFSAIPYFAIFFVIGIGASILPGMSIFQVDLSPERDPNFIKGVILYQILFVANTEECIFRSLLPKLFPSIIFLGIPISSKVISSIVFGAFHFSTYYLLSETTGQNLTVMLITATLAGLAFQAVKGRFGLPAAMGLHSGLNVGNLI